MSRVVALVEGQTEQGFVGDVLAPWLGVRGVYMTARLIGKPGHKGGVGDYGRARREMLLLLKQESGTTVTTMFDYYGMPPSWPGRSEASAAGMPQKPLLIERAIKNDICQELGTSFEDARFQPYVQMHEFEALLFSEPPAVCDVLRRPELVPRLNAIRVAFPTPEEINDGPATAPSKRLISLSVGYRKRLHGLIAATRIGIEIMRAECPHFAEWLSALERLAHPDEERRE